MKILRKISNRRRFAVIPALVAGALLLVAARAPVDDEQVGAVTGINGPAFAMQDAAPRVLKNGAGIFLGDVCPPARARGWKSA